MQMLIELNEKARERGKSFQKKRELYTILFNEKSTKIFSGIAGFRGCGKTVMLQQLLNELSDAFYISCDRFGGNIYSVANELQKKGIKYLLLDEISYIPKWRAQLKKIYDNLNIRIFFTSSSSIDVFKSRIDLSRRVKIHDLHTFSFREYIHIVNNNEIECINLKNIAKPLDDWIRYEAQFREYCNSGALPASVEGSDVKNIIERIMEHDLPVYARIYMEEISEIRRIFNFLTNSSPESISYSAISKHAGINIYKAIKYVKILESAFLINIITPEGRNVMKEPKILLPPPLRAAFSSLPENMLKGSIREDFFVHNAICAGYRPKYLKSNRGRKTPDYLIDDLVVEVGGRGKGRTQFKGFKTKKTILAVSPGVYSESKVPLIAFGFLCRKN